MRERLRATFGEDAERYERARPGYPAAVFEDFAAGTRVLEIGCGSGQATVPLAERGCVVTAVELSADLAAVASAKLADFPGATVEAGVFEDWPLPPEPFDVVLAATAFHWLDPAIRMARAAEALREGGTLALITTHHVASASSPTSSAATNASTRPPRPVCACPWPRTCPRRSTSPTASARRGSAAGNGT